MKRFSKFIQESIELDEASKEHLERLKSMLDKAKPGSADHSQIRHAISAQYGDKHIPAKHRNIKPDMYEAVEVSHDRYMRSHGKKASGGEGNWMFTHKRMGDANVNDPKEVHSARGKFSDAKKSAQQWAKKHGHSTVYVMEEVEQIDEISRKTLRSYMDKAGTQRLSKSKEAASHFHQAGMTGSASDTEKGMAAAKVANKRAKGYETAFSKNLSKVMKKEEVEQIDEISKEYYAVHRAASLSSAQMKSAAPGDQPSFHKTEADAINHLNKKYKKVRDGVWKDSKGQFFFHKKHSSVKEEVEQIDELKVPSKLQKVKFWLAHGKTPRQAVSTEKSYAATKSSDSLKRLKIGRTSDNVYKKGEIPKDDKSVKFGSPAHMQIKAIDRELKKRNEEVEQIDELKKSTLGSYIKKASARAVSDKTTADRLNRRAFDTDNRGDSEKYFDASDRMQKKYKNRLAGISKATDRLTKEEVEQIDEYNTKSSKAIVMKDDKPVAIYPDLKSAQKDYYGKDGHAVGMRSRSAAERIRKANPGIKIVESVEQIDEISADLAHDVYKKRMAQAKAHVQQDNYSAARKAEKKAGETSLRMVKKILRREETELDNGYIESTNESVEMSMNQRKALEIGRKLQMMATKEKNDTIANAMANLGDHLESFGATFGPKNMSDLMKKTGLTKEAITMLIQRAQRQ